LGQIAKLTIGEKAPHSQLTKEIDLFVRKIAVVAIITAVIFFIVGLVLGYDLGITFSFAIGIFVAYVPQGLPVTVSVLLVQSNFMCRRC
jgi:sodium/potassium-transporting ATPase subunit alpha